ncbi:MAG TPA: hypothetical protein VHX86_13300 [Tepidisphaeraceae bacterium]|nr:hypothetical protein [Tepidisphaeraceae bacterium]
MLQTFLACLIAMTLPATALADVPTTQPALKVAVTPFDVIGNSGQEWMGRALQEGLATGLQKTAGISAVIVPGLAPANAAAAIDATKSLGADAVIFGSIQVLDDQIRIGGRIVSMKTGQTIGQLQCDGTVRGLFDVEDILSDRAGRVLKAATRVAVSRTAAPVSFEIVGPSVATRGPQYFDGDISAAIAHPERFRDDYDRYYYHSADTAGWGTMCGAPFSCGVPFVCGSGNPVLFPVATPVSGW